MIITINSERNYHNDARRRCLDRTARCVIQFRFVNREYYDALQLAALILSTFNILRKANFLEQRLIDVILTLY